MVLATLLAAALQIAPPAPDPPDCAVYAAWLRDQDIRSSWLEHNDTTYVRAPFGFSGLTETSQSQLADPNQTSRTAAFLGVLPPGEQADLSRRSLAAHRRERERLHAEGVRGNELLDQTADLVRREFPVSPVTVEPDPGTLASAATDLTAGPIHCAFEDETPASTVLVEFSHPTTAWTDLSSGNAIPRGDAGEYFAFSSVAFNEDGREALVYVEYFCGGVCGGNGTYYLMRRGEIEEWHVVGSLGSWIN